MNFADHLREGLSSEFDLLNLSEINRKTVLVGGENLHLEVSWTAMSDKLVAFSYILVRGQTEKNVRRAVHAICKEAEESNPRNIDILKKLFLLAFSTRWCRGGKGEKEIFYFTIKALYEEYPSITLGLLDLLPHYGYWKDMCLLYKKCMKARYLTLREKIVEIYVDQLQRDMEACKSGTKRDISLCAKYAPNEDGHFDKVCKMADTLSFALFGDSPIRKRLYRRGLSRLRKAIVVTERLMCANKFSKIDFSKVPSLCLARNRLAFLNEMRKNDVRHPKLKDRVKCRANLFDALIKQNLNASRLYPHEAVHYAKNSNGSYGAALLVEAQWTEIVKDIKNQVKTRKAELAAAAQEYFPEGAPSPLDISNLVIMADVSGSMAGTPMDVAIGMGILCSEIVNRNFRDLVMTFSSKPTWVNLKGAPNFAAKVEKLRLAPWGTSTNFYGALQAIEDTVRSKRLKQGDIPDLMVISDMQFDQAQSGSFSYAADIVKKRFVDLGLELHGTPLEAPTIYFWNVRARSPGFPAKADSEGVVLLSGYSPALMKFVCSGEMDATEIVVDEETGMVDVQKRKITPVEFLDKVLGDPGLHLVRDRLDAHVW